MLTTQNYELEETSRALKMAMGKILLHLILRDPLIPLLKQVEQPIGTLPHSFPTLSNVVIPTRPRGSG